MYIRWLGPRFWVCGDKVPVLLVNLIVGFCSTPKALAQLAGAVVWLCLLNSKFAYPKPDDFLLFMVPMGLMCYFIHIPASSPSLWSADCCDLDARHRAGQTTEDHFTNEGERR